MSSPYYNAGGPVVVQGQEVGSRMDVDSVYNQSPQTGNESAYKTAPPRRQCRDVIWALLFYANLGAMAAVAVIYAPAMITDMAEGMADGMQRRLTDIAPESFQRYLEEGNDDQGDYGELSFPVDPQALLVILACTGITGLLLSTLALGFMMNFAKVLIKVALWFNIIFFGATGILTLVAGIIPMGLILLAMAAFSAYYAYVVWRRIPFAAANLVAAVTAVRANLGLAFYAYMSLLLTFGWSLWWSISFISTLYVTNGCDSSGECEKEANGFIVFLFLVSYFWAIQVISNVVHVTTAGTVGTWWFSPNEANGCCSPAVRDSWVRALTYSFGSICLGSLIVALIQAVKEMVHQARENGDSMLACCAECLIGCIEALVEYFNKWAFVYVGLYGFSFMESGKNVMALFHSRGWTSIITDYMLDTVLFMVSMGVGLLTAMLGVVVGYIVGVGDDLTIGTAFVIGFILGYAMSSTLFSVVSSAVNTVIVCYAEAPAEFQANHPQLSSNMRESWRQAFPNEFGY